MFYNVVNHITYNSLVVVTSMYITYLQNKLNIGLI